MRPDAANTLLPSILTSLDWIEQLLTGHLAIACATIMLVVLGFGLMAGRLHWRRAAHVLLGMVVVFGSGALAEAFITAGDAQILPGNDIRNDLAESHAATIEPITATNIDPQDSLQTAYGAAREAVAIRFPGAHGTARFTVHLEPNGAITHIDARGEGLTPEVVDALAQVIAASGVRLPKHAAIEELPPLAIALPSSR